MKYFSLILLCACSITGFAQTATVKGLVKDELSQQPIAHAIISLVGTNFSDSTGTNGLFSIAQVPYGNYTVEIKEGTHGTYTEHITVNQPEIVVGSVGLSVAEQEVERADRQDKAASQDNLPTVTISDNDLLNIGAQNIAGALAGSRDAFIATTSFVMSSAHFRIRGYDPGEFAVYLNGVPVSDLENGSIPSSSWGGLSNVFRNRDYSLGLGPNDFGFGGVGGSYYLDATASAQRKEFEVSYSTGNRNFRHRLMATYSTGVLKNGWAISASISKRWANIGDAYVPGTFYDGYSYYLSVDKHFGNNNTLSFTTFGSPTKEGKDLATSEEAYNLAGSNYYNPAWGYQNGQMRNGYISNTFQPMFILNDKWKIDNKSSLQTAAGFSFGKKMNSSIDYYNAPDPLPDYYGYLPSNITDSVTKAYAQQQWRQNVNVRQLNWDNFYAVNRNSYDLVNNINGVQGNDQMINDSKYILANTVQNQQHFNVNSTYNAAFTDHISLTAGAYYQYESSEQYREVADLLGGQYWLNLNHYAQLDYPGNADAAQNDLNHPNQLLTVGDKYGYDYKYINHHAAGWIQPRFHYNKLDFFLAAQLSGSSYWRNGLFKNGLFPTDSYGKSAIENFLNYAFKGGLTYNFDNHNSLYANGAVMTEAPSITNAFQSAEDRNQLVPDLKNEQIYSAEAGYQYKSPIIKARGTFYFTQRDNRTQNISFYDDQLYTDVNYALTGINIRNIGAEGVIEAKLYKGFSALAIVNIGRDIYTSRPTATVTDNNNATVLFTNQTIYEKNYNVGGIPQMAYTFGLSYHSPQYWFVDLYFNYYDWMWVSANPARLTANALAPLAQGSAEWNSIIDQQRLPGQFTMDMFAGYSWLMNNQFKNITKHKYYMVFSLNVSNLTNNQNFIVHGYEQNSFNFSSTAITRYPTKYTYMYGTNYLLTIAFRMN